MSHFFVFQTPRRSDSLVANESSTLPEHEKRKRKDAILFRLHRCIVFHTTLLSNVVKTMLFLYECPFFVSTKRSE